MVPREVLKTRLQSAIRADSFVAVARESGVGKGHAPDVGAAAYLRNLLRRVYTGAGGGGAPVFDAAGAAESAVLRRTSQHASEHAPAPRLSTAPEPRVPLKVVMQPRPADAPAAAPEGGQTASLAVPEDGASAPQLRVSSSRVAVPTAPALPSEWQLRESQPPVSAPTWGHGGRPSTGGAPRLSSAAQPRLSSAARAPASRRSQPGDAAQTEAEAPKQAHLISAPTVELAVEQPQAVTAPQAAPPPPPPPTAEQASVRPSRGVMEPNVSAAMRKLDPLRLAAASWTSTVAPAAVRREVDLRAEGRRAVLASLSPFDADPLFALLSQAQVAVSASRAFMACEAPEGVDAPTPRVDIQVLVADSPDVDFPAFAAHTQVAVDQRAAEETREAAARMEAAHAAQQEEVRSRTTGRRGGAPARLRTATAPAPAQPAQGAAAAAPPRVLPFAFGSNQPRFPPPKAPDASGGAQEAGLGEDDDVAADVFTSLGARMLGLQPPGTPGRSRGIRMERPPPARRPGAGRHRTGLVAELRARMERVTAAAAAAAVTATATSLASQHETAIRSAAAQLASSQQGEQQQQVAAMHAQLIQHLQAQEERLKSSGGGEASAAPGVGLDAGAVEALIRDVVAVETARAMADLRVRLLATAPSAAQAVPAPAGERGTTAQAPGLDTPARERTAMTPPWGTPQPLLGSVRGVRPSAARRAAERVLSEWHSQLEPGAWGAPTPDTSTSSEEPCRPGGASPALEAPWSSSTPSSGWSGAAPLPPRLRGQATPGGDSERSFPRQSDVDLGWVELQSADAKDRSPPDSLPSPPQDSPPHESGHMPPADEHPWATLASPLPLTQPSLRAAAAANNAATVSHSPPATPQHRLLREWQMSPVEVPRLPDGDAVTGGHNVLLGDSEEENDDAFDPPYDTREHALRRAQAASAAMGGADDAQSVVSHHSSGSEPTGVEVLQSVVARLRLPAERG